MSPVPTAIAIAAARNRFLRRIGAHYHAADKLVYVIAKTDQAWEIAAFPAEMLLGCWLPKSRTEAS